MKLENGTTISHYKILSKIGKGGMGDVYLAEDTKLDRKVALKILPAEFAKNADRMSRFVREAKSASALNHPSIITIYEINEYEDTHFIATEFIDGKTLNEYSKNNPLSYASALDIAVQVASALDDAHTAGIVHRDIKPDNIMVRDNGLVKILDFGIAKLTGGPGDTETRRAGEEDKTLIAVSPRPPVPASQMTTPGMIIGTASYMSPEQAKGEVVDARTDIFSLGAVLYEMLAGHLPFEGKTPMEIIGAVIHKEPKPIYEELPNGIERIVLKALRKDKNERYQTIKGMLADLKEVKRELEFQDKLEKTVQPNREAPRTQILQATTVDDRQQNTTVNDRIAIKKSSFNKIAIGVLGLLLVSAIGFGSWYFTNESKQIESIAVMPFVNESGNEDVEYLSDGMTETLISSLTEIPNLSVKARSSVFYYKGKNASPKQIGEELNVEAVLLGRVTQQGDDLKLSLELVETTTLNAIWSETYNRKMSDLVLLQSEIAKNVSDKLRLKLTANEQKQIAKSYTANSEAQKLYLKGRFHWNKRTSEDLEKAEQYFKQAIEKDPNYALAYTGLADSYALLPIYGDFRPKEYFPRAKHAAQKALALDDDLAEAHTSLGNIFQTFEYDWANAEKEYKRALELNPNYASRHHWYGEHLSTRGDHDRAIDELVTALKLDPFSRVINRNLGFILYSAGKHDEAIVQLKKSIELFPDDSWGYLFLGDTYAAKGNYDLAVAELITYFKLDGKSSETINRYEDAYKKDGWKGFWSAHVNDQLAQRAATLEKNPSAYIQNWRIAQTYATIGNNDKAIEYLRTAIDEREPDIIYISAVHYFDPMRDDPRFVELMKKVGFPQIK